MLKATLSIWWGTHKKSNSEWLQCRRLMEIRFGEEVTYVDKKYTGLSYRGKHIKHHHTAWKAYPWPEWLHWFIHTLKIIPRIWYTLKELQWGTIEWESLTVKFTQTFEFTSEHPTVDVALQINKENIFEVILTVEAHRHQCPMTTHNCMECYNITREPDDNDPLEINILEWEGIRIVEGDPITTDQFLKPLK